MGDLTFQQLIFFGVVILGIINLVLDQIRKGPGGAAPEEHRAEDDEEASVGTAEEMLPPEWRQTPPPERPRTPPPEWARTPPPEWARTLPPEWARTPPPERVRTLPPFDTTPARKPEPAVRPVPQPVAAPVRRVAPPAPTMAAGPRVRVRRARVSPAAARRGVVLMTVLGQCRGLER